MADAFEVGDVVHLKSGGPDMTVTKCGAHAMTGEETVWCTWFDQKVALQNSSFHPGVLEKDE